MCHLSSSCELQGTCTAHVAAALTQALTRVEKFCPSLSLRYTRHLKSFLSIFKRALRIAMMKRQALYVTGQSLCSMYNILELCDKLQVICCICDALAFRAVGS